MCLPTPDLQKVELAVEQLLKALNLNVKAEHLKDTPKRIAKMYVNELLAGVYNEPPKVTCFESDDSIPVLVDKISVRSLCSHHFMPFYGYAVILYAPNKKIAGLSKFSRVVNHFAAKPHVQENLTNEIANYLYDIIQPWYIFVGLKCRHMCLANRGAKDSAAVMTTYCLKRDRQFGGEAVKDVLNNGLDVLHQIDV